MENLTILADVLEALQEDIGSGDISGNLLHSKQIINAEIFSREPMLVCGIPWVNKVFEFINPAIEIKWHVNEGDWLATAYKLCQIIGNARDIITAERTALNFLQALSGTATKTYKYVQILQSTKVKLLDTRKTLPKLRYAQKYAVKCAGGHNHRFGLYDAFLLKENHIKSYGSISKVINAARAVQPNTFLEIEVENLIELQEALNAKPDRILLDNFNLNLLKQAVKINQDYNIPLEASGSINLTNIKKIADTGIDYISIGDLTKSIQPIDLTLLIKEIIS